VTEARDLDRSFFTTPVRDGDVCPLLMLEEDRERTEKEFAFREMAGA
jgi:hypothetical protein